MFVGTKIVGVVAQPLAPSNFKYLEKWSDIAELRVDMLGVEGAKRVVKRIWGRKPVLVTVRAEDEGGKPVPSRAEAFEEFLEYASYIDVEINHAQELGRVIEDAKAKGIKVIASYHNFDKMPDDRFLWSVCRRGAEFGDIIKVAVWGDSPRHVVEIALFTMKASSRWRVATMLMGPANISLMSRIVCSAFGSELCYGSVTLASAPGQPDIKMLHKILRGT